MSIRAVFFDLDDTLHDHRGSTEEGLHAHRTALGGALAAADRAGEFARWHELEETHYPRYLAGELDWAEQRRERVRGFLAPYGAIPGDEDATAWFDAFIGRVHEAWRLLPDAVPMLESLAARGLALGIITNGEAGYQSDKLRTTGLWGHVDPALIVASGEVGVAKPDPRIFLEACRRAGTAPSETAFVGDRPYTDAIGAADAGLLGIWIRRGDTQPDHRAPPGSDPVAAAAARGVPVISSLAELSALLG